MKPFLRGILVWAVCGLVVGILMAAMMRSRDDDLLPTVVAATGAILGAIRWGTLEICNAIRERRK